MLEKCSLRSRVTGPKSGKICNIHFKFLTFTVLEIICSQTLKTPKRPKWPKNGHFRGFAAEPFNRSE
ncbi:hypothetical protein WDU94_004335 [Cyamophila willieti]